jgi:hypothetical protein
MANKKIKKIDIGGAQYDLCDATSIHTINGYDYEDLMKIQPITGEPTVTFANEPITTKEINDLLGIEEGGTN